MNILYDQQIFEAQKFGGISRYFYEIIKRIAVEEKVVLCEGLHINGYPLNDVSYYKYWGYKRFPVIPHTGMGRLQRWISKYELIHMAQKDTFDIYHPTYYEDYNVEARKLVVTVHDMIHELFADEMCDKATIEKKKCIIKKADGIIAVSENTKRDLINILDINPDKIKVIYHGSSISGKDSEEALYKKKYILFVGQRGKYKNFNNFIQAIANTKVLKDVDVVCFGGGAFSREEEDLFIKLGIRNKIKFFSGSDDMLANFYKNAQWFVYPSKYEGFGIPLLEAMNCECPIMAAEASCFPEILGDAGVYFNPNSIDDMIYIFDKYVFDESMRNDCIKRGAIRKNSFSWDRCAYETQGFYKTLL